MVGGDDRERLALEPDLAAGEHRLVGDLEAVALAAGHVVVGEHRVDAGQRRAAAVSIAPIRARGTVARSVAPHSMPSADRSEE